MRLMMRELRWRWWLQQVLLRMEDAPRTNERARGWVCELMHWLMIRREKEGMMMRVVLELRSTSSRDET